MTGRPALALVLTAALAAGGLAVAKDNDKPKAPTRYLADHVPDSYTILPPPPAVGSFRYEADRATFLSTRKLKGTARWTQATSDAVQTVPALMKDLSCAANVELSPETAPKIAWVLGGAGADLKRAVDQSKDKFKRLRPFKIDDGDACTDKPDSYDYPSGHTTWGWSFALILAELFPDRASEILARGRSYGESRIVCGVHNLSAIDAGRTNGALVTAALHGQPAFRTDLEAARKEATALRKSGKAPDPAACKAEADALAVNIYD